MGEEEVRAAHNVLEACAQIDTILKVVFTSSVTAVIWGQDRNSTAISHLDERFWNDAHFCRQFKVTPSNFYLFYHFCFHSYFCQPRSFSITIFFKTKNNRNPKFIYLLIFYFRLVKSIC